MYTLTAREEWVSNQIVDCAFRVHKNLGPGLLEKVYEICLSHEINKRFIQTRRQVDIPIHYDGLYFEEGLRLDLIVDELMICEIKAVETLNKVWEAQVLSQLKLTGKHVAFLINFNVARIKDGIRRYCL